VYDRLAAAQRCAREKNQPQFRQTGDEHRHQPDPQVRRPVAVDDSAIDDSAGDGAGTLRPFLLLTAVCCAAAGLCRLRQHVLRKLLDCTVSS
jgi:hypothetical protein